AHYYNESLKQLLLWVEKQTWQVASPYSVDKRFDVNTDGTVTLKRQVTLHEGHEVFSVHACDSGGEKHTVSIKVEHIHHHKEHHMDRVMNISSPEVLTFPKSSTGAKRDWLIPPFHVPENSRGPFLMKLGQIKSDFAEETQMVYSITGEGADQDPKGIFTVERLSGNLFVTQPLNREKKASYRLIAHAVGHDVTNVEESPMEILINVIDQNDNKPVFTQNPFNGHVPEVAEKGRCIFMTVTATDADDPETHNGIVYYAVVSQEPPFPKPNMFDINILSGTIRVRETGMDREQWPRYTLLIVAADMEGNGLSTTGTAVITITDSNDNPPQFECLNSLILIYTHHVYKVGHVVAKLAVSDGDEVGSPAWSTKYRIISGDRGGFFNVSTGPSQLEGIITTVKPLDFEKTKQNVLSVIVENDDPFVVLTCMVFVPSRYKMGNDPAGWLSVSPETGVIKVRTLMDRESAYVKDGKYRAIILAVDDDATSPATGTGTLIIELENVNDNAPVINERNIRFCNRGSAPILLSITDKDGPPHAAAFIVETQGETCKNCQIK
uniref:Cadherin domain-containing protein n=1 Tax=Sinocyclocheilus anshuiensis TaxID=1608454 RepID=A0A671P3R1_9TELE